MEIEYKFKQIYNPKSNRLQNYDYGANWWYFITICTKDREHYCGEILGGKMILNDFWKIVFDEIKNIWILLDEFVIMPNHIHLIIIINDDNNSCFKDDSCKDNSRRDNSCFKDDSCKDNSWIVSTKRENMIYRRRMLIPKIIWKLKMLTSKEINIVKKSIWNKLWQANYYDRIIRNEDELQRVRKYILENPIKWEFDKNNSENLFM